MVTQLLVRLFAKMVILSLRWLVPWITYRQIVGIVDNCGFESKLKESD